MVRALIPIYVLTLIDAIGNMVMIPLLPYIAQRFGATGLQVGALLAIMAAASTVMAPVWGAVSDKIGRKPVVQISQLISLIGYLAVAWAPTLPLLFVARAVAGIGGGNIGVTQSYIADVTDDEHRDRAFAAFGVVFGIGIVLGPITGGFLVQFGFWVPFCVAAAIQTINMMLTWRFLPATNSATMGVEFDIRTAAKSAWVDARIRSLIVRHFLFIFAVTYFFSIFALYVKHALHFGPQRASILLASAGLVGGIALVVVVGPLARRFGDAIVAQVGFALNLIAYSLLVFARDSWTFLAVLVVWAIGASCIEPTISALLSESVPQGTRGATLGYNDAMSSLALMAAPLLGGLVIDRGLTIVGVLPGAAVLAAFVIGIVRHKEDASLATGVGRRTAAEPAAPA